MIATHHPKPDRLFPSTKTAIAPTTQHPIAYFPHQTSIASSTPTNPIAYFPQNQTAIALIEILKNQALQSLV